MLQRLQRNQAKRAGRIRLDAYRPYPRQAAFHAAGAAHRERLFIAGNQLGKTWAGACEEAMHATGRYPAWWQGRRFAMPTVSWVAGITGESTRDTVQRLLLGRPGAWGTGALPVKAILDASPARGVPDLVDTIRVRHVSGGVSLIALKSYEKGRAKWQGETLQDRQQQAIDEAMKRYQFAQTSPWDQLQRYAGLVQGNYGNTITTSASTPRRSIGQGMLGGAAAGAQLGSMVMPGWGTAIGAVGGGLLGAFG